MRKYFELTYKYFDEPELHKVQISGATLPDVVKHFWQKVDFHRQDREITAISERNGFGKRSREIRRVYGMEVPV